MPAPKRIFQTPQSRIQLFLLLAFLKVKIVSCGEIETVLFFKLFNVQVGLVSISNAFWRIR